MRHCLLNGNAYAVIVWGKNGQPQSLHPYPPSAVIPQRLSDHRFAYTITEPYSGKVKTYLQKEVLHLHYHRLDESKIYQWPGIGGFRCGTFRSHGTYLAALP